MRMGAVAMTPSGFHRSNYLLQIWSGLLLEDATHVQTLGTAADRWALQFSIEPGIAL